MKPHSRGLRASLGALVAVSLSWAGSASADTKTTVKGMVGAGLLGAEVVVITESLLGVEPMWAYLAGTVVGGGAGALGGYYLYEGSESESASFMMAGGIALFIPGLIAVTAASYFQPPSDYRVEGADEARLLPSLQLQPAYTREEMHQFAVEQQTELHFSLVGTTF